jgi:hypothetical protein
MADVKLFNSLFSDCSRAYPPVTARGLRVGVPRNFWEDLGWEVCGCRHTAAILLWCQVHDPKM